MSTTRLDYFRRLQEYDCQLFLYAATCYAEDNEQLVCWDLAQSLDKPGNAAEWGLLWIDDDLIEQAGDKPNWVKLIRAHLMANSSHGEMLGSIVGCFLDWPDKERDAVRLALRNALGSAAQNGVDH